MAKENKPIRKHTKIKITRVVPSFDDGVITVLLSNGSSRCVDLKPRREFGVWEALKKRKIFEDVQIRWDGNVIGFGKTDILEIHISSLLNSAYVKAKK